MTRHSFPLGVLERLADGATVYIALRQDFEMPLEFAAEYAGIDKLRLWEIEGGVEPTPDERQTLAGVYGVAENALISG